MMKYCQKINLQEPQRNRNATANFVNFIMTSTVATWRDGEFAGVSLGITVYKIFYTEDNYSPALNVCS